MRLSCPNCNAQYEIDASLVPQDGRDVQCSACDHVWFQKHVALTEPSEAVAAAKTPLQSATLAQEDSETDPEGTAHPEDATPVQASNISPRTVSGDALEILRQEAEFEARRRADEMAVPEDPSDPPQPNPEVRVGINAPGPQRFSASPPDPVSTSPQVVQPSAASSRTQPAPEHAPTPAPSSPPPRRSRKGLFLTLLVLPVLVYLFAPGIIIAIPEAEQLIARYVGAIDALWLQILSFLDL